MKLNDTIEVNLHLIPNFSKTVPDKEIDISTMRHVNKLNLADPAFNVSNKVDLLLGADVIEDILLDNKIKDNCLCFRESVFGWVVSGPVYLSGSNNVVSHMTTTRNFDSYQLLLKFWEKESVPETRHLTMDERRCKKHFDSTRKRNEDGRFVVQMPFKDGPHNLGLSKANAMKRFIRLEHTLRNNVDLFRKYSAFIQEFIDLGHLEKVQPGEINNSPNFYLPHHCVLKEDGTTSKLRVVFDASAKTTTGFSLNDCLLVGPTFQDNLFNILVRFRFFKIALSADVAKMYRQVELKKAD